MKYERQLIAAFACGLLASPADAVDPDEFAVGWPLELAPGSEFYDIPLNADVYRNARSVSQIAVLDVNGEPMPFYRVLIEPEPPAEEITTLGVSPVYQTQTGELITDLTVETSDEVVNLSFGAASTEGASIVAFIADAREIETPAAAIDLDWAEMAQPFMTSVVVSHSEDLDRWEVIGRGTIASLAIDGARVRHGRIPVSGRSGGYYRLGWSGSTPAPWLVEELSLVMSREPDAVPVELVQLPPITPAEVPADADENALFFDAGGSLPARAVELGFGEPNRWANAVISGSDSLDGPWRRMASRRLYYRVEFEGRQLGTPPVQITRTGFRYWKVQPDRSLSDGIELRLHYPQERLRFAANGSGPYQLVGGGLSSEAGPDAVLRQVWEQLDDGLTGNVAELGAMRVLGGDAAFVAPSEFPWRSALLWGALLFGALTVGWMSIRLAREAFGQA